MASVPELQGPVSGNAHPTVGDLLPADVPVAGPRTIPPQKHEEEGVQGVGVA